MRAARVPNTSSEPREADAVSPTGPSGLSGGGEMGERVRAANWELTALGPTRLWPQPLRSFVGLMLNSAQPMFMAWGQQRIWLYNDAFIPILGRKHP